MRCLSKLWLRQSFVKSTSVSSSLLYRSHISSSETSRASLSNTTCHTNGLFVALRTSSSCFVHNVWRCRRDKRSGLVQVLCHTLCTLYIVYAPAPHIFNGQNAVQVSENSKTSIQIVCVLVVLLLLPLLLLMV